MQFFYRILKTYIVSHKTTSSSVKQKAAIVEQFYCPFKFLETISIAEPLQNRQHAQNP